MIYHRPSSGVNGEKKGTFLVILTLYHYEYQFTESGVFVDIRVFFHEGIGCTKLYTTKECDCMLLEDEEINEGTVGELRMTTSTLEEGDVSRERVSRLVLNSENPRNSSPQMSALLSLRRAHCALSFVAQFVVIWFITCQTEGLVHSQSVLCL